MLLGGVRGLRRLKREGQDQKDDSMVLVCKGLTEWSWVGCKKLSKREEVWWV
jgi:hypothetical protein